VVVVDRETEGIGLTTVYNVWSERDNDSFFPTTLLPSPILEKGGISGGDYVKMTKTRKKGLEGV